MKNNNNSIQEMLNALADGQLESVKREELQSLLANDPELRGELCDIYRTKELVQSAYPIDEFEHKSYSQTIFNSRNFSMVATILVAFLVTLGAGYAIRDSGLLGNYHGIALTNTKIQDNKVILFISSSKPEKFKKALLKAEELARKFNKNDGKVYVVASADGIDLLRASTSPHSARIQELTDIYPTLDFIACNNTLHQYKKAGKPIELIDSAKTAPSAVEFVVKHLQLGWQYIAI